MTKRSIILISLCLLFGLTSQAAKYWVFVNKQTPLLSYKDSLSQNHIEILQKSKWFHAYAVNTNIEKLSSLKKKPWVDSVKTVHNLTTHKLDKGDNQILQALEQMNATALESLGLNGKGVKIGICDAGFVNADSSKYFKHLFEQKQVIAFKDFVSDREDFYKQEHKGDSHGFHVWKRIGGKVDTLNYGLANQANFYLARTENAKTESRIEEYNWIAAIEWLDSLGVRVVSTSLGYSHLFDDKNENYLKAQMDGNSTLISKAAKIAITEKNMILIASAGNEGHRDWRIVSAPADVEEMITVGANLYPTPVKANYSSEGADFVPFLKPDVSCYSERGTSFSAPTIAGLVACLLQFDSSYTYKEIKEILYKSSHLYQSPNNYLGYGIPNCNKIVQILNQQSFTNSELREIKTKNNRIKIKIVSNNFRTIVYHKKDEFHVIKQSLIKSKRLKKDKDTDNSKLKVTKKGEYILKLKRYSQSNQTTILTKNGLIEVYWAKR